MGPEESITICNWNACSLQSKMLEFIDFLDEHKIDICVITETHLKPEVKIYFPDFRLVRLDRTEARGGGVAIALRNNINCRLLPSFKTKTIEAIGVEVSTSVGPITIIAAYCPKQAPQLDFRNDLSKLTRRQGRFIIAGDLNAKHEAWGNACRNRNGIVVQKELDEGLYTMLSPDSPTRLSSTGSHAIIDIFLTNMATNIDQPVVINELSSDHYPVVTEVGSSVLRHPTTKRNYHQANWQQFRQQVDSYVDYEAPLENPEDIDRQLQSIEEALTRARELHIPVCNQVSNTLPIDRL